MKRSATPYVGSCKGAEKFDRKFAPQRAGPRSAAWLGVLGGLMLSAILQLQAAVLWQIGVFDESSREFDTGTDPATGQRINYAQAGGPVFVVGQSAPAKDWRAFQPGSANGRAGFRQHPFTIQFQLAETPRGRYSLKIALLAYAPRLSRLQVEINGHRAWFYQQPEPTYSAGDPNVFYLPHYAKAQIAIDLPTAFLKQGANELVLTAIDEPGERDDTQPNGFGGPGSSGLIYDALLLEHEPAADFVANEVSARIVPTVFFKRQKGKLVELVDVFVRGNARLQHAQVTLSVGKTKLTKTLSADREFGEHRVEFAVPEFTAPTPAEVTVSLSGRTRSFSADLVPARKWTLFVVPHEHLDIGYTDSAAKVAELHSRTIDEAMELIRQNPDFRFTLDGYWIVEQFLAGRSSKQQRRFIEMVKANKLFVPAQYGCNFTGFQTLESLIRTLYPSHRFARRTGAPFDHFLNTDVPSYSWSQASVLAAAGVKYFVAASDAYRAPLLLLGRQHEQSPQWWEGPDGRRVLTWYSRHYHQVGSLFGMPPQVTTGRDSLPRFIQIYNRPEYKSDATLLYGTQVENIGLFPQQAKLVEEWNKNYAYPKLRYAGFTEALDYITRQFGDTIPVVRGDGGPYWEDGLAANAAMTALARENGRRALTAEKFATISSLVNPVVRPDPDTLAQLWQNLLLFDEHTFHADRSVSDPESQQSLRQGAVKDARATESKRFLEHVLERSLGAIADQLPNPSGTLVVFNSLNWARDGVVEVDLGKGLELVDLVTRQRVPFEVLATGNSYQHVRIVASQVPALGYKCYALKPSVEVVPKPTNSFESILENPFYRVVLEPESGGVRSIFDKELERELVDAASPYRFNHYLYVTGADELPNRLVQYSTVSPLPRLELRPAQGGRLVAVTQSPLGIIARLESSAFNTPRLQTEIILFNRQKRIEFINRVQKTKTYAKEGVYFAFPLAMEKPCFRYETQNGFVDPAKDLLPGAGREWFAIQHWIAAEQDGVSAALVPVDAPLITLGDIARGTWPAEFGERKATIFSYVMNNYTPEGYAAGQGGEFTFRYVFTSGRNLECGALSRLGWEEMTPLEVNQITPNDKPVNSPRPLAADQGSFLQIDQPNIVLTTWKIAEDGKGTILRFVEVGGTTCRVQVTTPLHKVQSAWQCNAVEEKQKRLVASPQGFEFETKPFQITTVRGLGAPIGKTR